VALASPAKEPPPRGLRVGKDNCRSRGKMTVADHTSP
jgi:hypothetical protein